MKMKKIIVISTTIILLCAVGVSAAIMTSKKKKEAADKDAPDDVAAPSSVASDSAALSVPTISTDATAPTTDTPYAKNGKLSVSGTDLINKDGCSFQLQGLSTHGIGWFPQYVSMDTFQYFRDNWHINAMRLAMYTAEDSGYCTSSAENQAALRELICTGVDACTELGMYAIVDWHILSDNAPSLHTDEAASFFDEISKKYKDNDNILYEICNEPNGNVTWADIKAYALQIIPIIRANDPDAIIIVGTPTWSQDVDLASMDQITEYDNLLYTLHFYADTHRDALRDKLAAARANGLPVIVSEFGICDASGNGGNNLEEGNKWIDCLNCDKISYFLWNLSNKPETCAILKPDCNKTTGFTEDDFSEAGLWYYHLFVS